MKSPSRRPTGDGTSALGDPKAAVSPLSCLLQLPPLHATLEGLLGPRKEAPTLSLATRPRRETGMRGQACVRREVQSGR